jgi:NADH:ubiquinone oxidoreductase subunit K
VSCEGSAFFAVGWRLSAIGSCRGFGTRDSRLATRDRRTGGAPMMVNQFLVIAALLFSLGVYGLLVRRNIVMILLAVELMLNAVNINLVAFESVLRTEMALGQVFTIFIITVAAAEVGIGLAIILLVFRNRQSANVDDFNLMKY